MPPTVKWTSPLTAQIHNATLNVGAGLARLRAMAAQFHAEDIARLRSAAKESGFSERPAAFLGTGELGLNWALACVCAGAIRRGVGVFHELEAAMENRRPHWARKNYFPLARAENALALKIFAEERGIPFEVDDCDLLVSEAGGGRKPLPERLVEMVREAGPNPTIFNSVAFARYMGPARADVPPPPPQVMIRPDGRITLKDVPIFDEESVIETIATMGQEDSALREGFREAGLLGPDSIWGFPTWPGGSRHALGGFVPGIYKDGALGRAKITAERAVIEWNMNPDRVVNFGPAVIFDFPAFLSGALWAIPGGPSWYMPERQVLSAYGVFQGMERLAPRSLALLMGPGWIRQNPLAFIQLEMAERLHAAEIEKKYRELQRRVWDYFREQGANTPDEIKRLLPLPADVSHRILMEPYPVAPSNYLEIMAVFREPPEEEAPPPPAVPQSPAPKGAGQFGDALVAEGEPTAAGVPFETPPPPAPDEPHPGEIPADGGAGPETDGMRALRKHAGGNS